MSSFGNFVLLSLIFVLTAVVFIDLLLWTRNVRPCIFSGFSPVSPQVTAVVTVGSDFAAFLSAAPKVKDKWWCLIIRAAHFDGYEHLWTWWCMWNAKYDNHKPLTYVLSSAKRINYSRSRLQSYQCSTHSQCEAVPFTFSICFPPYSPVLSVVSRKVSHEGHVLIIFIAAVASPLLSSSFSGLSNSSVITVAALSVSL